MQSAAEPADVHVDNTQLQVKIQDMLRSCTNLLVASRSGGQSGDRTDTVASGTHIVFGAT